MLGVLDSDITSNFVLFSTKKNSLSLLETKRYQKKFKGLSAVEIGAGTLTDKEQRQAAFERDYWSGLYDLGLNYHKAKETAEEYFKKLQESSTDNNPKPSSLKFTDVDDLKICCTSKKNYLDSLQKLLIPEEKEYYDESTEPLPGEGSPKQFKPALILVKTKDECNLKTSLETIEYIGYASHFDFFLSLLNNKVWQQDFKLRLACGRHTVHFRATRLNNEKTTNTDKLVSDILSVVMISGRPIRNYNATFYLPLDLSKISNDNLENCQSLSRQSKLNKSKLKIEAPAKNETDSNYIAYNIDEDSTKAQIQAYFSPLLHDQLFDSEFNKTNNTKSIVKPVRHYQLKKWKGTELSITDTGSPKAIIQDISLYRHELGQGLLAIHLESAEIKGPSWYVNNKADSKQWWHDLVVDISATKEEKKTTDNRQTAMQNQLENWLTFTHAFRTLYQSFISQKNEDKLKKISYKRVNGTKNEVDLSKSDFNPFIKEVLESIASEKQIKFDNIRENLQNDRMFVNAVYALSGPSPDNPFAKEQNYRIFTIAANVDRQQDASPTSYVYSKSYIKQEFDKKIYKRWESIGSYSSFTDHAHIYLGYGKYTFETISRLHVPYIYGHMTLLNLLYHGQLRHFEQQLCHCHDSSAEIKNLYSNIELFTNQYWFHEVTEQQQGKEIFKLQSKELELEKHYQILDNEIKASEQNQRAKLQDYIGKIGLILAFLGLIYAILPTQDIIKEAFNPILLIINESIDPNYQAAEHNNTANKQNIQAKSEGKPSVPMFLLMQLILLPLSLWLLSKINSIKHKQQKTGNFACLSIVFFFIFQFSIAFILIKVGGIQWLITASTVISLLYVYWAIKTILFNDNEHHKDH